MSRTNYNIKSAKAEIIDTVKAYLYKDPEGEYVMREVNRLPIFLLGPPGVGKTQVGREAAEVLGISFLSYSLTHHTRSSVLGLPTIDEVGDGLEKIKYTRFTMSEIIEAVYEKVASGQKEGILLLDEFTCMADSIYPIMLEFLQNKNIGRYRLPEGWVIIICGNPPQYNKASRNLDPALLDRVRLLEISYDAKVFLEYAKERGLSQAIINYLTIYPDDSFFYEVKEGKQELVTCRGWENLSETMKVYEMVGAKVDYAMVSEFIKCEYIAKKFAAFYKEFNSQKQNLMEELQDVVLGKYDKETIDSFRKSGIRRCMNKLEYVAEYLLSDKKVVNGSEEQRMMAESFENLLIFGDLVDPGGVIKEKLLSKYSTETILKAMAMFPQPLYKEYMEKIWKNRKYNKGGLFMFDSLGSTKGKQYGRH